jgi:methylase of polypeptide subunit release factors
VAASPFPIADRAAARSLGAGLRKLGYAEDEVAGLLGEEGYRAGPAAVPVQERRLPPTRLGAVVRLLFLQLATSRREAERALGAGGLAALEATGLAERHGEDVVPRGRIVPVGKLLLASDGFSRDADDPSDYVATYTPTSRLCDFLTPRRRVGRALDIGTGGGVHALLAARHARRVVATDVNPRALAFAEVNAAMNGFANVECRSGSLFEPAGDERFDLITCNAPYVVSPERRWAYRDAGFHADGLSERVVRGAAARLAEGGFATLLVSWVAEDEDEPNEHVVDWVAGSGCDVWILPVFGSEPLEHAASWNAHFGGDPRTLGAVLDEWTSYFDEIGTSWVSEGAILLHRRPGSRHTVRVDEVDEDELDPADAQIRRAFAARARLAELGRTADLLEQRVAPAPSLRLEHELAAGGGVPVLKRAVVRLDEGTNPALESEPRAAEVIGSLNGTGTLGSAVAAVARAHRLPRDETEKLRRRSLRLARELLELGALRFR